MNKTRTNTAGKMRRIRSQRDRFSDGDTNGN